MIKLNNKGLSLVELIISMSITVILMGMIAFFITVGVRNYEITDNQINVQLEAQSVINVVMDLVREGNNVSYVKTKNAIVIYHLEENKGPEDTMTDIIWLNSSKKKIYLYEDIKYNDVVAKINSFTSSTDDQEHLFGEYMDELTVKIAEDAAATFFTQDSELSKSTTMEIGIKLSNRGQEYETDGKVKLRNRVFNLPEPHLLLGS